MSPSTHGSRRRRPRSSSTDDEHAHPWPLWSLSVSGFPPRVVDSHKPDPRRRFRSKKRMRDSSDRSLVAQRSQSQFATQPHPRSLRAMPPIICSHTSIARSRSVAPHYMPTNRVSVVITLPSLLPLLRMREEERHISRQQEAQTTVPPLPPPLHPTNSTPWPPPPWLRLLI